MLFNSFPFLVFLLLLLLALMLTPRRAHTSMLLGASLLFYAMWHPIYLVLLLADVAINYGLLRWMVKRGMSRALLATSIVFTLSVLGFHKYSLMAIETAMPLLKGALGIEPQIPEIFLPLGISFYSFQIIALTVDVYRGHVREIPSFSRYLLFVSFFPQLIAGPIVRGAQLLPQLAAGGRIDAQRIRSGCWLLCAGLAKKVVMGDFLLAGFVDEVFAASNRGDGGVNLIAMYAFAFQIYFDFAGYTDMARGIGRLLGYDLPANFHEPYLSLNPNEFWRRWHITLSSWFRDYVYIPLGGNRRGEGRTRLHLLVVFFLSGLWHGAAWNFVLWGLYHGLWLIGHRLCRPLLSRIDPQAPVAAGAWAICRWLVTFHLAAFGFILFRAATIGDAVNLASGIFTGTYRLGLPPFETLIILLALMTHLAERWVRLHQDRIGELLAARPLGWLAEGAVAGVIVALAVAASGTGGEFIYFQF